MRKYSEYTEVQLRATKVANKLLDTVVKGDHEHK
jgi:hypothetical protein